ncbi:hypothetical protein L3X39_02470 [Sabulilitoribacter multivorans]|uniref:DUF4386 domain-containing protein n=1 Tax=Flaviramulus multivorans TaxID=1304750 RepID=A0ABS9IFF1_9FLAO|nr:hypothetical protein [Flaviramulus multivorans]MCF7559487.1 hypothetical protein [Flaviramulus multivorans]
MKNLTRYSGVSLILGGLFFAIPNTVILPFVDFEAPFSELLTSTPFFYRMIFAALTVAFLLFGSIGVYLNHSHIERVRKFRQTTFILAFFGSAFMFANEWHQIFVLPEIAILSPDMVDKLGSSVQTGSYAIGAMIALATFSFGWILFSISLLVSKKLKRIGPALVIVGFLIIPLISGIFTPVIGGIVGGVILGIGFSLIGIELLKSN